MDKTNQKKQIYNDAAVKALMERHKLGRGYILKFIRGERNGTLAIKIQEEYKTLDSAAKVTVNEKVNNL